MSEIAEFTVRPPMRCCAIEKEPRLHVCGRRAAWMLLGLHVDRASRTAWACSTVSTLLKEFAAPGEAEHSEIIGVDLDRPTRMTAIVWLAVCGLVLALMALGLVDLRLTWRLKIADKAVRPAEPGNSPTLDKRS